MQENNTDQPPSLSQLLRESYLAETRAQHRHSEMSRSDSSLSRCLIYRSLKGKADDSVGHDDPQLPDLSAFLNQEELDKSVNLARQAIGHDPHEERAEVNVAPSATLSTMHSDMSPATLHVAPTTAPSASFMAASSADTFVPSFATPSATPLTAPHPTPHTTTSSLPAPEIKELPPTHTTFSADRKMHKESTQKDNTLKNKACGDNVNDRSARSPPYGVETQSKKEFLNKAADFIEELSSLFKANSSKRIRPRACKAHRSRVQSKSQNDGLVYPTSQDDRERPFMPLEMEVERPNPVDCYQPEVQLDSGIGHAELSEQDSRTTGELHNNTDYQEVEEEEEEEEVEEMESPALTETPYSADPFCEPPHFIQKLKSREVLEGSKVQLDCIVRGCPEPEVRWFCEGKELEDSPDIQIITDGELHSLIITEAFEEDTGRYSCFASNFYGTDSTSAEIYIEGASSTDSEGEQHFDHVAQLQRNPTKPDSSLCPVASPVDTVSSLLVDNTISPSAIAAAEETPKELSSQPANQEASVPSPPAQISTPLPSAPDLSKALDISPPLNRTQEEPATLPIHVFPIPSPEDTGLTEAQEVSTPVAITSIQTATSVPFNPVVSPAPTPVLTQTQIAPSETQNSNHSHLQGFDGRPLMAAPVFTKSLQDVLALEGQLVVLECRVKGVPSPKVDWYREGTIIDDSPDFRILQKKPRSPAESEEICTLVIAEVFSEDSGLFTCTASNKYGTVSSIAALKVKGNSSNLVKTLSSLKVEYSQEPSPLDLPAPTVKPQPEVTTTNSTKPCSSAIRLDPLSSSTLHLDPLSTSTLRLDPHSSTMLRPDPLSTSLPSVDPLSLSNSLLVGSRSTSTPRLDPIYLTMHHQDRPGSNGARPELLSGGEVPSYLKPISGFSVGREREQQVSRSLPTLPEFAIPGNAKVNETPNKQSVVHTVVPLPDPPANSCLKTGVWANHKDPRSSSRVGLRVHFKLPEDEEDEQSDTSGQSDEDNTQAFANKEPPPVLAKPKLDPVQLQLLHNQVLMEQQQESDPPNQPQTQTKTEIQPQPQTEIQSPPKAEVWSPRLPHEPPPQPFQLYPNITIPQQPPQLVHPLTTAPLTPSLSSPALPIISSSITHLNTKPASPLCTLPSAPQLKTALLVTGPSPAPQLTTAAISPFSTPPATQMNTIHASHLNLSPVALSRALPSTQFSSPMAPQFSTQPTASLSKPPAIQQITSPTALLRTTHASLINLAPSSQSFNYARPKEFIAAQTFSPVRSPSPTESPVPMLQELAAELNSSAASSPTIPPFSLQPRVFPTRELKSPTSPPTLVMSPTPPSAPYHNSVFAVRAQSPPQASSPTSSSSTPSPIQNPVAFLSSVLPSLPTVPHTNAMGLPKGAPPGILKKLPRSRLSLSEDIRESKETLIHDIEKKLRFKDDTISFEHQQKLIYEGKTASRPLGPNIAATVFNYDEEYKVSNFEQRLMSEIEFRLERTPVEESDDEVQHDEIPTGKCIAPIFDKKLKNFRAMEGVPVTFSCKVVGIPLPKVYWFKDGKQILRKNDHYKRIREGDGTCALHIPSTTNDDDGNYTIMAANPQGRISCSGHLIVQTGPPRNRLTPIHSSRVRARIQEVEEGEQTQERFFRPHFLQAPGDMQAHEGRLCRLDCKVSGLPNPELMWLVNGKPIYPDLYHKMLIRENGIHSLVIEPLTQNDAGTYTCIASNKAGQSSFSLELQVVEKEMKQPPYFVEKLQNTGIPEGSPVRLDCRVVGMPPPVIFWKKDNDTIPKTKDRFSMHQDATGYVCLHIQPTKKDDAGWYTVSAKNEAGIVSCTSRLDIYAQWHQSIPMPMKKTPRTGSRYAALTGQGLDIKSAFPTSENSPILFSSSPPEVTLESEEL
ncbi:myopalladin [Lampris incognitus]|uniref:myopalladin n=1 Tax=Lampris incognitus TaxID=2546036 RepID=UPI0024B4E4C4|nr:myopalladin [Lampris incognitus]